jgi:hypothetical protein
MIIVVAASVAAAQSADAASQQLATMIIVVAASVAAAQIMDGLRSRDGGIIKGSSAIKCTLSLI